MVITETTHCAVRGYQPSSGCCIVLSIASVHDPLPCTSLSVDCIWYNDIITQSNRFGLLTKRFDSRKNEKAQKGMHLLAMADNWYSKCFRSSLDAFKC